MEMLKVKRFKVQSLRFKQTRLGGEGGGLSTVALCGGGK